MPLPISDIVLLKSFRLLEAGTIAVLKRLGDKSQVFFLEVALATVNERRAAKAARRSLGGCKI